MLYRKYRPQTFDEVTGQEHVVKTLKGALSSGRIGHAYLFTGPRGTGKTTLARLLAKALNCKNRKKAGDPDNTCEDCIAVNENRSLDMIEIDAASNRGIDEVRNLKESATVASLGGGYKVFIVDEVHMLTQPAFNALLKILEEPSSHVVFILATTEPHKILQTVLSRVQRFDFKRLNQKEISEKLRRIAKAENLTIDDKGLTAIAASSDGALRDAEVSLSKIMASYAPDISISLDDVNNTLGLIPYSYNPEFLGYLASNNKEAALDFIQKVYNQGVNMDYFAISFIEYLRRVLMHNINPAVLASVGEELLEHDKELFTTYAEVLTSQRIARMLKVFINAKEDMGSSPISRLPLELAVLELAEG